MELDLTPKLPKQVYGGDGGSYHAWCPEELPMLKEGNIGAAKLALEQQGFAVPRYSDSPKVAYVLQGSGTAGIVLPEKEEKVIAIKKGDSIALPFGVVTWWFNSEETDLVILFLGETHKAHKPGQFTDIYLTGSNGIFTGIVKLEAGFKMPQPKMEDRDGFVLNCLEAPQGRWESCCLEHQEPSSCWGGWVWC
uniref:Cupin type-1 domain-containing protein n=1 Tax=Brassica oleracea TaxID=3712 RepID=A0A3P6FLR7_BRAOL|nr:unnamed protein product [Brassica oleracea]